VVSYPQDSPPKPCIRLSSPPYVLHTPLISFFSILSPEQYWVIRSLSHSLRSFFNSPVTSSLLGPNILHDALFSTTPYSPRRPILHDALFSTTTYSPRRPILKRLQSTFLTQCERPNFTPIQNKATGKIIVVSYIGCLKFRFNVDKRTSV
jgi:hypothetical protein